MIIVEIHDWVEIVVWQVVNVSGASAGEWPAPGCLGHGFLEPKPRRSSRMSCAKGKEELKDVGLSSVSWI